MDRNGVGRTWAEWWAGESDDPATTPGRGDITASCYSEELNEQLIQMCRNGDPACQGNNMANLLEMDYCDDYWSKMVAKEGYVSMTTMALVGAVAIVGGYLIGSEIERRSQR